MSSVYDNKSQGFRNKGQLEYDMWDLRYYLGCRDSESYIRSRDYYYPNSTERWYSDRGDLTRSSVYYDNRSLLFWRPPYTEGSIGAIRMQAVQNLVQALLPKGVDSISVKAYWTNKATGAMVENEEATTTLTDQARQILNVESLRFHDSLTAITEEFLTYGNAVIALEPVEKKLRLQLLPFHKTYFGYDEDGKVAWVHSETSILDYEFKTIKKTLIYARNGTTWNRKTITEVDGNTTEEVFSFAPGFTPILVVRESRYQDTGYGWGSGLIALPHIKVLNWASDQFIYATQWAINPTTLIDSMIKVSTQGQGEGSLFMTPGSVVALAIKQRMEGGQAALGENPIQFMKGNEVDMQYLTASMVREREQIQSIFFVDPVLSVGGANNLTPRTATEVVQRQDQALILYRGKASILKSQFITPLVKILLEDRFKLKQIGVDRKTEISVEYYSADSHRATLADMELLERSMAFTKSQTGETNAAMLEAYTAGVEDELS